MRDKALLGRGWASLLNILRTWKEKCNQTACIHVAADAVSREYVGRPSTKKLPLSMKIRYSFNRSKSWS